MAQKYKPKGRSTYKPQKRRQWTPPGPPPAKPQKPHKQPRNLRPKNRTAGSSARGQSWALRSRMWGKLTLLGGGVVLAAAVAAVLGVLLLDGPAALVPPVLVGVGGWYYLRTTHRAKSHRAHAWNHGAEGEAKTAAELKKLGAGWFSFHDLQVPGSKANIDHLVVGPGGVYVVDTKAYRGTFSVKGSGLMHNGESVTKRLNTTKWEASRAHDALSEVLDKGIVVKPIWAVWGADFAWGDAAKVVNGVTITKATSLVDGLRAAPERLTPGEVDDVARLARTAFKQA